jgi:hypothetical protein
VSKGIVRILSRRPQRRLQFAALLLIATLGCDPAPEVLPEVWTPLGYETVVVDLAGCAIPLPPVRDSAGCSAADIGKRIDVKEVCRLLVALKGWVRSAPAEAPSVRPADWALVRAVCVYRSVWIPSPHAPPEDKLAPRRTSLTLYADVPNRSHRLFVQMSEQSGRFEFSVAPR